MADARYVALAKELVTQLTELLDDESLVIQRRLVPRYFRKEFDQNKKYISIFAGSASHEVIGRQVDNEMIEAVIAIQAAGPDPAVPEGANPFGSVTSTAADPVEWGDEVFAVAEQIKDLWRAETEAKDEGALHSETIVGCVFESMEHSPLYVADHLEELGILSIVLQVMFRVDDFDAEED